MLVAILRIEYYLFVRQLEDINFYLTSECNHSIFVINQFFDPTIQNIPQTVLEYLEYRVLGLIRFRISWLDI